VPLVGAIASRACCRGLSTDVAFFSVGELELILGFEAWDVEGDELRDMLSIFLGAVRHSPRQEEKGRTTL